MSEVKLLTEAEARDMMLLTGTEFMQALRERGLIAPEPVDPLHLEAAKVCSQYFCEQGLLASVEDCLPGGDYHEQIKREFSIALAALRRDMELAERKELTREMVERAVRPSITLVSGGGGCLCEVTIDCPTIHDALTEALK